ncbi:MAG TPA: nucleotide exchange factor GrpE [Patescibacteria group bacterium]|jgi:molecular chaperone GrpE|nr:nucleotide exchange factor GrpE [Patescibacteria group bacterium]
MNTFFHDKEEIQEQNNESEADTTSQPSTHEAVIEQVVAEWKQRYAYLSADFENFKRRSAKEHELMRISVYARLLKPLLLIIDDFDRACDTLNTQKVPTEGFKFIRKSFEKFLTDAGVVEMTVGTAFDPEKHEALMQVQAPEHKSGDVVAVLQKGYVFNDVVLRPAKVSVAE